jgi:hypothetical protein
MQIQGVTMIKPLKRLGLILAAGVFASCGSGGSDVIVPAPNTGVLPSGAEAGAGKGEASPGTELCDASAYAGMIGTNVAAATFPSDPKIRVFGENDIVTRDYIPQRTNIVHDESGIIREVYCG